MENSLEADVRIKWSSLCYKLLGGARMGGGREEEWRGGVKWKQKVGRRCVLGIISEGTNAAASVFLNPEAKL